MANGPRQYRRRQYLVAKKFQLKYVGLILLLMYITGLLCSYLVYYTSMILLGEKLASVYPQGRLIAIVRMVNLRIILSMVLATPLVAVIGIFLSHRVAGPWFRMESYLTDIAAGNLKNALTLRSKDELVPLANKINKVVDSFKQTITSQRAHLDKAVKELEDLKKSVASHPADTAILTKDLNDVEIEMAQIGKELDKYKL